MKKLLIAVFLVGCGIPFEPKAERQQRWIAGQAEYPSVPIEAPAADYAYGEVPIELRSPCSAAADCGGVACVGQCREWMCEDGFCVLGSRRGRLCVHGEGRAEVVGVCNELGECKEVK